MSKYFTIALLSLAIVTAITWLFIGDSAKAWGAFTAILIVACPCALALSTPFTLGNALRILGKNKMYLKNADVVEQMAQINQIVFDKTGTLTQNNSQEIVFTGVLNEEGKNWVAATVKNSSHPLSRSIYEYLDLNPKTETTTCNEVAGKGIEGEIEGKKIQVGSDAFVGIASTIASNSFDTPLTQVFVSINDELKGYFAFTNKYRNGVENLTQNLRTDYVLHVLSGDNSGEQVALQHWFDKENLHFNCKPQQKLDFVKDLQNDTKNVMMIGDGLNDAGALKQSDVGIALTDEVSNFTPACDAVLDASELETLPTFMRFSEKCVIVIKSSFALSLVYNAIGLYFAVQGTLSPLTAAILMPISSITVVSFTTGLTNVYAKRLKLLR